MVTFLKARFSSKSVTTLLSGLNLEVINCVNWRILLSVHFIITLIRKKKKKNDSQSGPLFVWSCTFSYVWVLQFPSISQRCVHEVNGNAYIVPVWMSVGVCPMMEGHPCQGWVPTLCPNLTKQVLATYDPGLEIGK